MPRPPATAHAQCTHIYVCMYVCMYVLLFCQRHLTLLQPADLRLVPYLGFISAIDLPVVLALFNKCWYIDVVKFRIICLNQFGIILDKKVRQSG